ncbi:MAG TPA: CCA tRNA nucleotidyltransferase [Actinomycetota bacterium]|nr:CCA tRNA nucleotidyltransferase [Actinomycetota bacterium]
MAEPPSAGGPSGAAFVEIDPLARELGERFRDAGFELHLVGGVVRDQLLGRVRDDFDIDLTTSAKPPETVRVLQGWADQRYVQGARFGTVGARKGERRFEITTFREEMYPEDERKPAVTFGKDLRTDLSRRDFTFNAMAVSLPDGAFEDPFGGVRDLAVRKLDTPLEPDVAFSDDPLRMLRAARFVAELGVTPSDRVVEAIARMRSRLAIVSRERVQAELSRLLVAPEPGRGLQLLVDTGLAEEFLPELPALALEQDPVHKHKDVLRHTYAVVEGCDASDLTLRLAGLFHDVGKPATRSYTPAGVQFHHHEVVGARMAEARLRELRYPSAVVDDVRKLIEMHLRFHGYGEGWSDAAVRRYVRDAGPLLDRLNQLTRADVTTANLFKAKQFRALQDDLEERIARLAEEENLDAMRPALDGNEIMEHLGLPPGRLIGEARDMLMEARLDQGPMEREEALALLDDWAASKGIAPPRAGSAGPEDSPER